MPKQQVSEAVRLATRAFKRYWHFGWVEQGLTIVASVPGAVFYSYNQGMYAHDIARNRELVIHAVQQYAAVAQGKHSTRMGY